MTDLSGRLMRKARRSVRRGRSENCEMVRFMRWSRQRFMIQRRIKEFYLRLKEVRRKQYLRGGYLRVKYKLKRFYGGIDQVMYCRLLERARKRCRKRGLRLRLIDVFVSSLERRVDAVIFRMNFAVSVEEAGEYVERGFILVNGRMIRNCNVLVNVGDVISVRTGLKGWFRRRILKRLMSGDIILGFPSYFEVNYKTMSGIIWTEPRVSNIPYMGRMDIEDVEGALV